MNDASLLLALYVGQPVLDRIQASVRIGEQEPHECQVCRVTAPSRACRPTRSGDHSVDDLR